MGRRKVGNENIRKLQVTGRGGESYSLTLPKEFVRDLKWQVGQKLVIEMDGDHLIIRDWPDKP